nr:reverse transcriptase domain-containing protein [Tanacetum cinerariifolium]
MEEDYKPVVQCHRRVNPKIHNVIKKEVEKLLDARLIYPISDSLWVSPVHCVPKKGGFTVIENEDNELIPTRLVTGWRGTNSIVSSMVSSGIFKFPLTLVIRRRQRSPVPTERLPIDACLSVCAMHWARLKGKCLSSLDKMLQMCEDTNLSLNWEKSHLMVKESNVLGHKISKNGIKVDRAKVDVIAKLPHPTNSHFMVKESNVLGHKISKNGIKVDRAKVDVIAKLPHPTNVKGENRASWSDKLDDALWAFRTAYKTPIGCTPYKLVYRKACHLLIELEHKAYWALKQVNFDLAVAGDHRKVQLNELNELCDHAYENSLIYKEKTKRIHDSKIKNRVFNVGKQVLIFNSRLKIFSGKHKTRWSGPFTIIKVFPYGTVELSQANGPNFKVNGHRVKHYFRGDVPQLDYPDCEVFRALSFSFTRASHPQLYFGNPIFKSYRLTFSFGIPNKRP